MPNHCSNTLVLTGPPKVLANLLEKWSEIDQRVNGDRARGFTYHAFVPHTDKVAPGASGGGWLGIDEDGRYQHANFLRGEDHMPIKDESGAFVQDPAQPLLRDVRQTSYLTLADGTLLPKDVAAEREISDWYDWNIANWGTKWDAYDVEVQTADIGVLQSWGEVRILFDSAWGPPTAAIQAMQEQIRPLGVRAKMHSVEPGMGFQVFHDERGEVQTLDYRDMDNFFEDWDEDDDGVGEGTP